MPMQECLPHLEVERGRQRDLGPLPIVSLLGESEPDWVAERGGPSVAIGVDVEVVHILSVHVIEESDLRNDIITISRT